MRLLLITLAFVLIALLSGVRAFGDAHAAAADVPTAVFVTFSILAYATLLIGLARTAEAYSATPDLPANAEPTPSERYI